MEDALEVFGTGILGGWSLGLGQRYIRTIVKGMEKKVKREILFESLLIAKMGRSDLRLMVRIRVLPSTM